jgi:hypothetical protein
MFRLNLLPKPIADPIGPSCLGPPQRKFAERAEGLKLGLLLNSVEQFDLFCPDSSLKSNDGSAEVVVAFRSSTQ